MKVKDIISERICSPEKHLCASCNRLYTANVPNSTMTTTQDLHVCEYRGCPGVETEDNGMGYWVTKCPNYIHLDTKGIYSEWMQTDKWKTIAAGAKKKSGYKCEVCGSAYNLCVHHTTYENLCREDKHSEDLVVVCRNCHANIHEKDLKDMAKKREQAKREIDVRNHLPSDEYSTFGEWMFAHGRIQEALLRLHNLDMAYKHEFSLLRELALFDLYRETGYIMKIEWGRKDYAEELIENGIITFTDGKWYYDGIKHAEYFYAKQKS